MSFARRAVVVLLMIWLPLQAVAGELLHAHEAPAAQEIDHLTHDATSTPGDDGSSCPDCAVAHGFCHLVLNPGIVSSTPVDLDDRAAPRYLQAQVVQLAGLGADRLDRPPLLHRA
jgi:hypothetical protein